ncbi:MAG: dTDP-4-dehydrorhamnose reductase [Pontibacterium sp.]
MKIFLTGSSGQVGFELLRDLSTIGVVTAPSRQELDLSDTAAVSSFLEQLQPDLIVNPAAWTAVDAAEGNEVGATLLNQSLPEALSLYAKQQQTPIIHFSTDYVYPGNGDSPWSEESETGPLSIYGRTKLAGDNTIKQSGVPHLIFRTSWVYAARGNNFLRTMLRLGMERESLSVVNDQIGAPTPARLISCITLLAATRLLSNTIETGTYHLVTNGYTSWHGFAKEIFQQVQGRLPLSIDPVALQGIPSSEYPTPATRPLNSRLDVSKLEAALGIQMPTWQSQLKLTLDEYLQHNS